MESENKEMAKELITSFHINQLNQIIDECTNKTMDFESSKLLKEAIKVSMDQICEAFLQTIEGLKKKGDQ